MNLTNGQSNTLRIRPGRYLRIRIRADTVTLQVQVPVLLLQATDTEPTMQASVPYIMDRARPGRATCRLRARRLWSTCSTSASYVRNVRKQQQPLQQQQYHLNADRQLPSAIQSGQVPRTMKGGTTDSRLYTRIWIPSTSLGFYWIRVRVMRL